MNACASEWRLLGVVTILCASGWVFSASPRPARPAAAGPTPESVMAAHPPTHADVSYGPHKRNILNVWIVPSDKPTPLVFRIHGGGFMSGGPTPPVMLEEYLKAGISVGSMTYRFSYEVPYPAQMLDCARAVQFLRSKAKEWNLDPNRFGAMGGSSGGGISLWLGFHDDMANPASSDPIERQSTRLACMAVNNTQTSYDPRWIQKNIPGPGWKIGPVWQLFGLKGPTEEISPELGKLMEESSPINYLTKDDPPVRIFFTGDDVDQRLDENASIHHPRFGRILKAKMDELGIPCEFSFKAPSKEMPEDVAFFVRQFAKIPQAPAARP
ncbi:MAG: alpha/beta hydrolase [Planctomycetota bacterium]|nr:alpha/beta hydrolase [Planctomycetota bacterium]